MRGHNIKFIMHIQTNTFQAVLAANNESSYIIFLYEEGGIQWTTGDNNGGINGSYIPLLIISE